MGNINITLYICIALSLQNAFTYIIRFSQQRHQINRADVSISSSQIIEMRVRTVQKNLVSVRIQTSFLQFQCCFNKTTILLSLSLFFPINYSLESLELTKSTTLGFWFHNTPDYVMRNLISSLLTKIFPPSLFSFQWVCVGK